jgi:hypothetical protein
MFLGRLRFCPFLQNVQKDSAAHPAPSSMDNRDSFSKCTLAGRTVKLTTHLQLVSRLIMSGSIPPILIYFQVVVFNYAQAHMYYNCKHIRM